jgi:hypothetical protein
MKRFNRSRHSRVKWCNLHQGIADGRDLSRGVGDTGWSPWYSKCGTRCLDYVPRNKKSGCCIHYRIMWEDDVFPKEKDLTLTEEEKQFYIEFGKEYMKTRDEEQ